MKVLRKSNINQNPKSTTLATHASQQVQNSFRFARFAFHTPTRQQNQNPRKGLSRLDLLLSFHRNKPKVELVCGMFCLTCLLFLFWANFLVGIGKNSQDFLTKRWNPKRLQKLTVLTCHLAKSTFSSANFMKEKPSTRPYAAHQAWNQNSTPPFGI